MMKCWVALGALGDHCLRSCFVFISLNAVALHYSAVWTILDLIVECWENMMDLLTTSSQMR